MDSATGYIMAISRAESIKHISIMLSVSTKIVKKDPISEHLIDDNFQVRRLHLIMVDLWRQKWLPAQTIGPLRKSMQAFPAGSRTLNTTPIRLSASTGRRQHQIRFVYGYALDGIAPIHATVFIQKEVRITAFS